MEARKYQRGVDMDASHRRLRSHNNTVELISTKPFDRLRGATADTGGEGMPFIQITFYGQARQLRAESELTLKFRLRLVRLFAPDFLEQLLGE